MDVNVKPPPQEGYGTYTFSNGEIYEGKWKDGLRDGYGTLKMITNLKPQDYPLFIRKKLRGFILNFDDLSKQKILLTRLDSIMKSRLEKLNYTTLSPIVRESIIYALNYVDTQSPDFQKTYVDRMLEDCVEAYDDGTISCAAGIFERMLLFLKTACTGVDSDDCKEIIDIIDNDPNKLVDELILKWYKMHNRNKENKFPEGEDRKANLIAFLMANLPTVTPGWIETKLIGLSYDDGDFEYEGGRKKGGKKKRVTKKHRKGKAKRRRTRRR
jgi:hypothetical protein